MKKLNLSNFKKIALWKKLLILFLGMGVLILPSVIQEIKWRNSNNETDKSVTIQEPKLGSSTKAQNLDTGIAESGTLNESSGSSGNMPPADSLADAAKAEADRLAKQVQLSRAEIAEFNRCRGINDAADSSYRQQRDSIVTEHRSKEDYINANFSISDQKPLLIDLYASSQQKANQAFAAYRTKVMSYGPTSYGATCLPGYNSAYVFSSPYGY